MKHHHGGFADLFKVILTLAISISFIPEASSSNDNYPFGGRAAGMGNASVTLYDFWAVSHNQAGLSRVEGFSAGAFFENRFLIPELSFGAAAVVVPTQAGVIAANFTFFGFELYNEAKIGLAYARSFGERLSIGMQLNYHNTSIGEDYGNKGNITAEAGVIYQLLPQLSIGAHIFNPARAKVGEYADERIPTILKTGLAYTFSDRVILATEVEMESRHDPVFKAGIEYRIADPVYVRAGIGTNPASNAFGFGLKLGNVSVDLASSYHFLLGYSPQVSFIYHAK